MGRRAGIPNKATADARRAIADFVDGNAHRLTEWLDAVAQGVKTVDPETGEEKYAVPPNPAKAFDMFQSVVEYHVPKLARMEVAGDRENPLEVDVHVNVFGELLKNLKMQRQSE
jgi:hypothetical protein